jgi:hypothetical protein
MARSGRDADAAAGALAALLLIAVIVLILLVIIATELFRVYRRHAFRAGRSATALWIALAIVLGCGTLAVALTADPSTAAIGAYLLAWSFPAFVVAVEIVARIAERRRRADQATVLHVLPTPEPWWNAA